VEALGEAEPERELLVVAGVRIVTATGAPSMRISSGSSTATRSRSLRPPGNLSTSTGAAEDGGTPSASRSSWPSTW